jgi:FkbM family methyltransferase
MPFPAPAPADSLTYPIEPVRFSINPFREEWYEEDYIFTPEGASVNHKHPCKHVYDLSHPFIGQFRTAVDVGCRMGEFSRFLQHDFDRLYAFDAAVHPLFSSNVKLENVTAFQCALGNQVGEISMSGGGHAQVEGKMRTVPVFRLDDFGLEKVDYIKIDVEGYERRVILGGLETIKRDRPLIVVEQNDVRLPDEEPFAAKKLLEGLGYRQVAVCKRGWDHIMVCDGD